MTLRTRLWYLQTRLMVRMPRPRRLSLRKPDLARLLPTAILIPTLARPHRIRDLVANIHAATPEPHRILFCTSDPETLRILAELGEWCLDDTDDPDKRYVTRMNKLVTHIGDAQTIFFGSDDVVFHRSWLHEALVVMAKGSALVAVNDRRNRYGTQALMRRDYLTRAVFDAPGLAFHSGYQHNFCESEQFATARALGLHGRAWRSVVEHLHPAWKSGNAIPWDETYDIGQSGWATDKMEYERRLGLISDALGVSGRVI